MGVLRNLIGYHCAAVSKKREVEAGHKLPRSHFQLQPSLKPLSLPSSFHSLGHPYTVSELQDMLLIISDG